MIRAIVEGRGSSLGSTEEIKLDTGGRFRAKNYLNKQVLRIIDLGEGSQNQ